MALSKSKVASIGFVLSLLVGGLLFFLIGVLTPYWRKERNINTNIHVDHGIWFEEVCENTTNFTCGRHTHLAKYRQQSRDGVLTWAYEYEYSQIVGREVVTLISLVACLAGSVCGIIVLFYDKWRYSILTTPFLLVAECLMWPMIGHDAAMAAYKMSRSDDNMSVYYLVPDSIILTAIGMFLLLIVALVYFVKGLQYVSAIPYEYYNRPGC